MRRLLVTCLIAALLPLAGCAMKDVAWNLFGSHYTHGRLREERSLHYDEECRTWDYHRGWQNQ